MEAENWEEYPCLHPNVVCTLQNAGYERPTTIQSEVFQNYRHYFDFLIASQTGSGKTLSFAAPIVSDLLALSAKVKLPCKIVCLVMAPTRQLAQQIDGVFSLLLKGTEMKHVSIFGGLSVHKQLRVLKEKGPQIIIGTPGRIQELIEEQEIDFEFLKYLVIDEADRMIEMGHYMELDKILNKIFSPKLKETFDKDFNEINQKLSNQKDNEFYIKENGKKKKITFNINAVATDQLFEVPLSLFQIDGEQKVEPAPEKKQSKKKRESKNLMDEKISEKQREAILRLKRRIFFISATLTRDFKGTKYFIKRDRSVKDKKEKHDHDKRGKKGQEGKEKGKKKESEEDYIPKLKALLSRVKFDAKPKIIDLSSQIILPAKLKQKYCFCEDDLEKFAIILSYIKELPSDSKCIIFTNTIRASKRIKFFIDSAGIKSSVLHSHMMQKQRLEKLERFKKSSTNILISTDVAARGLDFDISNVVQFSVPINGDTYVHRVGRTARANRSGEALVLISRKEATKWEEICNIITASDPNRKAEKYHPLQSTMNSMMDKVKEFEWIRLNEQELDNKRVCKLNEMEAEELGVEAESEEVIKKVNQVTKEEERLHQHMIKKQIEKIRGNNKNIKNLNKKEGEGNKEFGDGKVWKKNKLVMSLDEIKKFL